MVSKLLDPADVDALLRAAPGYCRKLARRGLIPFIRLPDGEIRVDPEELAAWLSNRAHAAKDERGAVPIG